MIFSFAVSLNARYGVLEIVFERLDGFAESLIFGLLYLSFELVKAGGDLLNHALVEGIRLRLKRCLLISLVLNLGLDALFNGVVFGDELSVDVYGLDDVFCHLEEVLVSIEFSHNFCHPLRFKFGFDQIITPI